jgi:hypothetical protein
MVAHVFRPLIPMALVFSLVTLCNSTARASDSSDDGQPYSYGTNPPPSYPPYGLETPDTQGSRPRTDLYGNPVSPSEKPNLPPPEFSNPPSNSSAPKYSKPWDYHTPSRGCFGEGC